jgi:hypothetical protein
MHSAALLTAFSRAGLMAGIALAAPICACAADVTADATPYVSDPSFLPRQGEFYTETSYDYVTRDEDWRPGGGVITEHYTANSNTFLQQIQYGITNRLSVGGYGSYADTSEQFNYTFQPSTEVDVSRFNNPTFNATYRALEQFESPVSVYVEALFSPAIVANAPGSGGINVFVNRELRFATSRGEMGLTLQGEIGASDDNAYTTSNPLNGVASDVTGQWNYFLAERSQLRLTQRWAINSGVVYSKDLGDSEQAAAGETYVIDSGTTVAPYVALVYAIVPSRANLALEYDHDFIGDDYRSGAINGTWTNQSQNIYELELFLRF